MTTSGRRTFLLGGAAIGAGAALFGPGAIAMATAPGRTPLPSARVGGLEVIALLDAAGPFPLTGPESFPNATAANWAAARRVDPAAFGPNDTWTLSFHCFAIRRPDGKVTLVDTGIGPVGGPASGWAPVPGHLLERLSSAGIGVADVDTVVLTHLHEDHYGASVSPQGVPTFPSATYVLQHNELAALPENDIAWTYVVNPLRAKGQLREVDGRAGLPVGRGCDERLTVIPTPGHTPGHQSLLVDGSHRQVIVTGDVLVHAVQLVDPDVGYVFESDQDTAAQTRHALFASARRQRSLLATAHLTRPFVAPR